jgi:hypothetical protein
MRTNLSIVAAAFPLALAACTPDAAGPPPGPSAAPAATATVTAKATASAASSAPATRPDRSGDPKFALKEEAGNYVGLVGNECPAGAVSRPSTDKQTLVGGKLIVELPHGGCPKWAGYTVVTGKGSPLPYYVCDDAAHDTCEAAGTRKWAFDISEALKANTATAVTYSVPTGVR